ncbi:hypothetical protein WJX74_004986 [Apatococcus lobatus]|uniref:BRO1 domain-containing protein n=1 Tax=Apatococcus lobatus TaxID=904363 RepID=A0AAW1R3C3_9CHLO
MQASPALQPQPQSAAASGAQDRIFIQAHLLDPSQKATAPPTFEQLNISKSHKGKPAAESYIQGLTQNRERLVSLLVANKGTTEDALDAACQTYISLLLGLINPVAADAGSSVQVNAQSVLRRRVTFAWLDALVVSGQAQMADAVFELASVLTAVAIWKMKHAAAICREASSTGADSSTAAQAFKLLRSAAGMLQSVLDTCLPHLFGGCPSADCNPQVVAGLRSTCLADAQSLTVLRAIQKGNAPGLIAGLAADTGSLYTEAEGGFRAGGSQAGPASSPKLAAYCAYKAACFNSTALAFTGTAELAEGRGGAAVKCTHAAQAQSGAMREAGQAYDSAAPTTPAPQHAAFDQNIQQTCSRLATAAKQENDRILFQHIPTDMPAMVAPKRLTALQPFELPSAALEPIALEAFTSAPPAPSPAQAQSAPVISPITQPLQAPQEASAPVSQATPRQQHSPAGNCLRWLLVIIAFPILAILSIIGIVIWIILLPIKIICCPVGCLLQIMANAIEYLVKAPFKALMWASGKPWQSEPSGVDKRPPV